MKSAILVVQIIISTVLVVLVLIQSHGSGLGKTFGGSGGTSFSRRGLERLLYKLTFVIAGLFVLVSLVSLSF